MHSTRICQLTQHSLDPFISGPAGVYGLYFDKDNNVIDYKKLLSGTTWNCGGGLSPWNTWISCEETKSGQCWQIDPNPEGENHDNPKKTLLGGSGGQYESVVCQIEICLWKPCQYAAGLVIHTVYIPLTPFIS